MVAVAVPQRLQSCLTAGCRHPFDSIGPDHFECRAGHRHLRSDVEAAAVSKIGERGSTEASRIGRATSPIILPSASLPPILPRFVLQTAAAVEAMPPPAWAVDGHIVERTFVVMFGASGSGKSFAALALAASKATGVAWYGVPTNEPGCVVYVVAEGLGGFGKRITAWRRAHPKMVPRRLMLLGQAVNLTARADVEEFITLLAEQPDRPVLVIFDTLARCMVGGDENSTRDMGLVVDAIHQLIDRIGCTVVVVHHTGHGGDRERGSSALRGAADTSIRVAAEDGVIRLTCEKQKDAEQFSPMNLKLVAIEGTESAILTLTAPGEGGGTLSEKSLALLMVLRTHFLEEGASASTWLKASGLTEPTFFRHRTTLSRGGYVSLDKKRYTLTAEGRSALALTELSANSRGSTEESLSRSHPL